MNTTRVIFDTPWPPLLVAAIALAAMAATWVWIRRDALRVADWQRRLMPALSIIAMLMLTGLMLSPTIIRTWPDPQPAVLAVLVDASRSMAMPHDPIGVDSPRSREQVARDLLRLAPDAWLSRVARSFDVTPYRFTEQAAVLSMDEQAVAFSVDEAGYTTAIGEALEAVTRVPGDGQRPRAIVLVSDGASNAGRDPVAIARAVAALDIPIYTVGVGDPDPPRDLAVLDIEAPDQAILGDEITITPRFNITGIDAGAMAAELLHDGRTIATRPIGVAGEPVRFRYLPTQPGAHTLIVRAPVVEGEIDTANNIAAVTVQVVEQPVRVLMIESEPRWEFRFLRSVYERDSAVEVSVCLLRPGVGPATGPGYIPRPPTEPDAMTEYDLFVIGDVQAGALPQAFLDLLSARVRSHGAALLVIAGRREHYRQWAGSALADLLPVAIDPSLMTAGAGEAFSPRLTANGSTHLLARLGSDAANNQAVWQALPPMRWSAAVGQVQPGAVVLLEHPHRLVGASRMPLMAVQQVGAGKVMFCGLEDTWRWRRSVGDRYHYRFWAQATRWLARKPFSDEAEGDPRARLWADRSSAVVGDAVELDLLCIGDDGFPIDNATASLLITHEDGSTQRVSALPVEGGWGVYRATWRPDKVGPVRIAPIVDRFGSEPLRSVLRLDVTRLDLERFDLAQNRATLKAVAEAGDGAYLPAEEVDRLPELLAQRIEHRMITAEFSPCRSWPYYAVMALAMGGLWLTRKRSGLA